MNKMSTVNCHFSDVLAAFQSSSIAIASKTFRRRGCFLRFKEGKGSLKSDREDASSSLSSSSRRRLLDLVPRPLPLPPPPNIVGSTIKLTCTLSSCPRWPLPFLPFLPPPLGPLPFFPIPWMTGRTIIPGTPGCPVRLSRFRRWLRRMQGRTPK